MNTPYEMTEQKAIKLLSKANAGEYNFDNLEEIFKTTCQKNWKKYNEFWNKTELTEDGKLAFMFFSKYINDAKYGLEYATKGKVRYVGTNDLNTLFITK